MKCNPATQQELKWIAAFQRLAKKCPESLWLFSASGSLCIMKIPEDGEIMADNGGVNQENIIDTIQGIHNDGGDW